MNKILAALVIAVIISCNKEDLSNVPYLSGEKEIFKTGVYYEPGKAIRGTFQPSVISTSKGVSMIFAQGRLYNSEDVTDKVLLFSRSVDEGKTWSETEYLTKPAPFWGVCAYSFGEDGEEIIAAMFVMSKPKLFELYSSEELLEHFNIDASLYNSKSSSILYQVVSRDGGFTWNGEVVQEDFMNSFDNNGNFIGFFTPVGQFNAINEGPFKGRMMMSGVVAYDHQAIESPDDIYDYPFTTSTIIYSDDQGQSWHIGGFTEEGGNESSAVAINNGSEIMIIRRRNAHNELNKRLVNYSSDGGMTWSENEFVVDLPSPKCLGVMYDDGDKLIYSTPKNNNRTQGWISYSFDNGLTWQGKGIQDGAFSYSDIEHIKNTDKYLIAYSRFIHGEFGLAAKIFNEAWLLE